MRTATFAEDDHATGRGGFSLDVLVPSNRCGPGAKRITVSATVKLGIEF
jgi:hypothetical protein